ncbi:family 20 glycosylhydrolase [Halosquirtibacter xylanolyticus]|uniref:family 20 glycosylhydrolase n=1 Tax=Halosquirtibacter xylanolyticus TaxID=3374599 RepID=UPI00374A7B1D|nr:family 20 glycosylhydrolase [Prolixibacteraceae bacterium]
MKYLLHYIVLLLLLVGCGKTGNKSNVTTIIPNPVRYETASGSFKLKQGLTIKSNSALVLLQEKDLIHFFKNFCAVEVKKGKSLDESDLKIYYDKRLGLGEDGYALTVTKENIIVKASSKGGVIYAIESLIQLTKKGKDGQFDIPCVDITDKPIYRDRMLRLDVSQRLMPVDEVKRIIDYMTFMKLNRLVLVIGKGDYMRVNLSSYPKLSGDTKSLYNRNDVSNILSYAHRKNVTIIPEVALFDNNCAVKNHYPKFCDASSYGEVVNHTNFEKNCYMDFLNPTVSTFVTSVIGEIATMFKAKYVCIGNVTDLSVDKQYSQDLSAGSKLDRFTDRYGRMQSKLIKSVDKQFFEKGVELVFVDNGWKYTNRKGALTIVMSSTAISYVNLNRGLRVIEAPNTIYDFDRPQSMNKVSKTTKNLTTLKKVYEFNPAVEGENIDRKNVSGVCAMIDAAKSPSLDVMTYKMFPRILAVADRSWGGIRNDDWKSFLRGVNRIEDVFKLYNISYGEPSYIVHAYNNFNEEGQVVLTLYNEIGAPIYYTLDGTLPSKSSKVYDGPMVMSDKYYVNACCFHSDGSISKVTKRHFVKHMGIHKYVSVKYPFSKLKTSGGGMRISDGFTQYFQRMDLNDVDLTVDLGQEYPVTRIGTNWMVDLKKGAFMPSSVTYYISRDGKNFSMIYKEVYEQQPDNMKRRIENVSCFPNGKEARYVRVLAKNIRIIPKWHKDMGKFASLYVDELVIE